MFIISIIWFVADGEIILGGTGEMIKINMQMHMMSYRSNPEKGPSLEK